MSAIIEGPAIALGLPNIDTDMIIAAEHLKTVTRDGLGVHAFATIRAVPGNPFADPGLAGAPILIGGANFGCGSSREHAVWALIDLGLRAVIAPSFADIFRGNAIRNGLLALQLPAEQVEALLAVLPESVRIDLEAGMVSAGGRAFAFELDPMTLDAILHRRDQIDFTLTRNAAIDRYEAGENFIGSPARRAPIAKDWNAHAA